MKTFKSIAGSSLFAAATLCSSLYTLPAHADFRLNGRTLNGISLQGISLNGVTLQGRSLNGRNMQGIQFNGRNMQGVQFNGRNMQGRSFNGIPVQGAASGQIGQPVAVDLPSGERVILK